MDLLARVQSFNGKRIVVVGDVMLDTYIVGGVHRISPEAPVPVVLVSGERSVPGGAANVALNIAALGGQVSLVGVVGDDMAGMTLKALMDDAGIAATHLYIDVLRPTTRKVRVCASDQQLIRYDEEVTNPVDESLVSVMSQDIKTLCAHADAVVVSDYAKGAVTRDLVECAVSIAQEQSIPILVDPKPKHASWYRNATLLTPNHHEARAMVGALRNGEDSDDIENLGSILTEELESAVLITRGKEGMSLFIQDGPVVDIPSFANKVVDVVGAGDSVVAAAALALAAGADVSEASILAGRTAAITVGKAGTTTVSNDELQEVLRMI